MRAGVVAAQCSHADMQTHFSSRAYVWSPPAWRPVERPGSTDEDEFSPLSRRTLQGRTKLTVTEMSASHCFNGLICILLPG